jgi:hypothetical protein
MAEELIRNITRMELRKQFRLALMYVAWAAAVVVALFFARAHDLESYNVGWGDLAADHAHAVLWWETIALMIVCLLVAILIGLASRLVLCSIAAAAGVVSLITLLGARVPQAYRIILFIPQLPGFFAAILALGVHGDEGLTTWWAVGVNTILYAPIFYIVMVRHRRHQSSQTQPRLP